MSNRGEMTIKNSGDLRLVLCETTIIRFFDFADGFTIPSSV